MGNLVSQADYARRRQCSEAYITKLKDHGKLVMVDNLVDVEESDKRIAENEDPSRGGDRTLDRASNNPAASGTYLDARTRDMNARAALSELELRKRSGELVEAKEVERAAFARSRAAQRAILLLPDRICATLAAETEPEKVRQLLLTELSTICREISDGIPVPSEQLLLWLEKESEQLRLELERRSPPAEVA